MKRVASLYLPHWAIERQAAGGHRHAPPPEAVDADLLALKAAGDAARAAQCDAPRNTGWRPGARWARAETERRIGALPAHRRPPPRELGRRSEAAEMPFRRLPGDDGGKSSGWVGAGDASRAPRHEPVRPGADPALLVTVRKVGGRVEIAAVAPAAAALGIAPGMALTQARASVSGLDVRDADPAGDQAALLHLATALARRWCPVVAIADAESLFLDLTGVAHLHGGEAAMARRIVRGLARFGHHARIAIADTTGAAWALARRPSPVTLIAPGAQVEALAPLPVAALRLDQPATDLLRRLGIDTIGDLLAMPRAPLVRRFGHAIALRLDQATGAAREPIDPVVPEHRIAIVRRFAEPIATAEPIRHWLEALVAELCVALVEAGRGARVIVFSAERVDATVQAIRIGLARPTRDAPHILRLIARRIEEIDPGFGIDALALHVARADPLGAEPIGARLEEDAPPDLAPLVDTLANRIGPARLWRTRAVESDVPERSVARHAPLDVPVARPAAMKRDDVRHLDARPRDHPWHPRWPRPARLLRRPERIDHVLAELPDFPPLRFTWRGTTHRIVRGDGPERIVGEWWRRPAERDAVRDYFCVEDDAGRRFWLFRRGDGRRAETGDLAWFMHGTFG